MKLNDQLTKLVVVKREHIFAIVIVICKLLQLF